MSDKSDTSYLDCALHWRNHLILDGNNPGQAAVSTILASSCSQISRLGCLQGGILLSASYWAVSLAQTLWSYALEVRRPDLLQWRPPPLRMMCVKPLPVRAAVANCLLHLKHAART